jgi:hypothetical protein
MVEASHKRAHEEYKGERVLDPYNDRVVKDVPIPPRHPLTTDKLYHQKGN